MGLGVRNFGVGARENFRLHFWQAPLPMRTYEGLGCKKGVFTRNGAYLMDRTNDRLVANGRTNDTWTMDSRTNGVEHSVCIVFPHA